MFRVYMIQSVSVARFGCPLKLLLLKLVVDKERCSVAAFRFICVTKLICDSELNFLLATAV
jgi:hypothetical protein